MKTKFKIIIASIVVLTLCIVAYTVTKGDDTIMIQAKTIQAKKADITTLVTSTGTIEPIKQVEVGTQVSGVVNKIYVDYNSVVTKGQLIAELDKTNLKASKTQTQAAYDNAITQRDYTKAIYERKQALYADNLISTSDFEDAAYNYHTAQGLVTQRLSDLERAETDLGYANIYAPIDGVVLSRDIDEGQTVAASFNTPTLFTIAQDLREMQVEADVDEADIGHVKEGQRVTFTVDTYIGEVFEGVVTQVRLNPTVTSNVVTYTVVITTKNPDLKLKPGLTATIAIYTLELKDVLTVEAKAINFKANTALLNAYNIQHGFPEYPAQIQEDATLLWVLNADGSIAPKAVTLGASDGVKVQILEGLTEGENLVYSLKGVSKSVLKKESTNESPFMPQGRGPGRI